MKKNKENLFKLQLIYMVTRDHKNRKQKWERKKNIWISKATPWIECIQETLKMVKNGNPQERN